MRTLRNRLRPWLLLLARLVLPLGDPRNFLKALWEYVRFLVDAFRYKRLDPSARIFTRSLYPRLHDRTSMTPVDAQYFYQQLWAFEHIMRLRPPRHVDIGSSYQMSGYLAAFLPTEFVDIRPIDVEREGLTVTRGSLLALPFPSQSVPSLSCLHVLEHIGLGRYGDPLDPHGTEHACRELSRVLSPEGSLYVSVPIGEERLCFNAHRVTSPSRVLTWFPDLSLQEFSAVDGRRFRAHADPADFEHAEYALGMYRFTRP